MTKLKLVLVPNEETGIVYAEEVIVDDFLGELDKNLAREESARNENEDLYEH